MFAHVLATIENSAVGNHAIAINDELEKKNIKFETFAETIRPEFLDSVKPMSELQSRLGKNDVVFYQFANPSPIADLLYDSECELILNYHNVTPAHFFSRWSPETASAVNRARGQLARLAPICSRAVAVSDYNAAELFELGYKDISVIPPVFSDFFYKEDDDEILNDNSASSWLYVGRIAPHKNVHVLIRAFEMYRDHIDSEATLTIVGSSDVPLYERAISDLIHDRGLQKSIKWDKKASMAELVNEYRKASVFVLASEHEGFCVPIIESMAMGLPVVAVNAAAIAETSSSAALLVPEADAELIVAKVAQLHNNPALRKLLEERSKIRSEIFDPRTSVKKYCEYIQELLS